MTDSSRVEAFASASNGSSVTVDALSESVGDGPLWRLLKPDEQPQHLFQGRILDIVDREAPESAPERRRRKVAAARSTLYTLVTDSRIRVVVPRTDGAEQVTVPYADVSRVDTEAAPGGNRRLRIYTDDTAYYADASQSDGAEVESAAEYVATRDVVGESAGEGDNANGESTAEILDAIERVADLHERGVLSETEFERKKGELLDRL